jgi:hypothetical protein
MKGVFIVIVALCIFSIPSTAHACSCPTIEPAMAFNSAKAVFIGRMLGGTEQVRVEEEKGKTYQIEAGTARFTVEELFKGDIPKEITIKVDDIEGNCGKFGLKRGELYVVYAYKSQTDENLLQIYRCTRTETLDNKQAKKDLKFLRNLPPAGAGGNLQGNILLDSKKASGDRYIPLSNVKIKVQGEDGRVITVTTDKNGKFEIKKIKAGKYRVEPQLPENYYVKEGFEEVEIDDRGTVDVLLTAYFTGKAEGRVVDKNGVGFNSSFLHFLSVNENYVSIGGNPSGENGEFSIEGIPPGEYVLAFSLKKNNDQYQSYYYPGTFKREDSAVFKVGLGEKIRGTTFVLPDEFQVRTIEGQVFWKDGRPAAGIRFFLHCPQSNHPNGYTVAFSTRTQTDENGKFKIEGFAGERYQLKAQVFKGDNFFHSPFRKIVLAENLKNINLVLSEEGYFGGCEK